MEAWKTEAISVPTLIAHTKDDQVASQELAGHQDLTTTQRYMHLSPVALDNAIRLLESSGMPRSFGDILETRNRESVYLPTLAGFTTLAKRDLFCRPRVAVT